MKFNLLPQNKKGNGNWIPLFLSLIAILVIGALVPYVTAPFTEGGTNNPNLVTYSQQAQSLVQNGKNVTVGHFGLLGVFAVASNPFGLLGGNTQNTIANDLNAWNVLPEIISIPLMILITVGLLFGMYKAIDPFG